MRRDGTSCFFIVTSHTGHFRSSLEFEELDPSSFAKKEILHPVRAMIFKLQKPYVSYELTVSAFDIIFHFFRRPEFNINNLYSSYFSWNDRKYQVKSRPSIISPLAVSAF